MISDSLRVTEIFYSLQGEARTVGLPTVFVRLTGCPLRCSYCDSEYAFYGGERMAISSVLKTVASYAAQYVCVTGGEPLAQPNALPLIAGLCEQGYQVSIETSGAMPIAEVDPRASIVMDLKTPASNESHKNLYQNLDLLKQKDQVKFVLCTKADYDWAAFKVSEYNLVERVGDVLFSPSYEQLSATKLADWIIRDNLKVRMQLQLHKLLWGDVPGV